MIICRVRREQFLHGGLKIVQQLNISIVMLRRMIDGSHYDGRGACLHPKFFIPVWFRYWTFGSFVFIGDVYGDSSTPTIRSVPAEELKTLDGKSFSPVLSFQLCFSHYRDANVICQHVCCKLLQGMSFSDRIGIDDVYTWSSMQTSRCGGDIHTSADGDLY